MMRFAREYTTQHIMLAVKTDYMVFAKPAALHDNLKYESITLTRLRFSPVALDRVQVSGMLRTVGLRGALLDDITDIGGKAEKKPGSDGGHAGGDDLLGDLRGLRPPPPPRPHPQGRPGARGRRGRGGRGGAAARAAARPVDGAARQVFHAGESTEEEEEEGEADAKPEPEVREELVRHTEIQQKEEELKRAHEGAFDAEAGAAEPAVASVVVWGGSSGSGAAASAQIAASEGQSSSSASARPAAASGPGGDPPPPPGYPEDKYKCPEKNGRTDIVVDGRTIGQLQPIGSWASYSVAARCYLHSECSRCRTWKWKSGEEPQLVERILIRWLVAGVEVSKADGEKHRALPRE